MTDNTRFIAWAELEASGLVRAASGCISTAPDELTRDVDYVLALADRIREQRAAYEASRHD